MHIQLACSVPETPQNSSRSQAEPSGIAQLVSAEPWEQAANRLTLI